jgi:hypothetical protein
VVVAVEVMDFFLVMQTTGAVRLAVAVQEQA